MTLEEMTAERDKARREADSWERLNKELEASAAAMRSALQSLPSKYGSAWVDAMSETSHRQAARGSAAVREIDQQIDAALAPSAGAPLLARLAAAESERDVLGEVHQEVHALLDAANVPRAYEMVPPPELANSVTDRIKAVLARLETAEGRNRELERAIQRAMGLALMTSEVREIFRTALAPPTPAVSANQCDGCRAGKPVDANGNHRMGDGAATCEQCGRIIGKEPGMCRATDSFHDHRECYQIAKGAPAVSADAAAKEPR